MGCYSALKEDIYTARMNFEDILLHEMSQLQEEKTVWFCSEDAPNAVRLREPEGVLATGHWRNVGVQNVECALPVWGDEEVLGVDGSEDRTLIWMCLMSHNCHLEMVKW